MKEITVSKNEDGKKVFPFLSSHLPNAPGNILHKSVRNKNITVNGKKASENDRLSVGDKVEVFFSDETFEKFSANDEKERYVSSIEKISSTIDILYEDEDILVVNKAAGILSQKAKPDDVSINEMVIAYLLENDKISRDELKSFRPSIENRLDRNTSGAVLFGKSLKGMQYLAAGLKNRSIHKFYIAIVGGKFENDGIIEGYLMKDNTTNQVVIKDSYFKDSQAIKTRVCDCHYDKEKDTTAVVIELLTGRTHQIRAVLSHMGHAIIGDPKYGRIGINKRFKVPFQLLHAQKVVFEDRNLEIEAPLPDYFKGICR